MKELMNWLNDSGVTTNRNQKFTYNSVQKLLTNKRYIGENHFKDIVMPDSIPAIVDKDLFEEVQLKIKKNSRAEQPRSCPSQGRGRLLAHHQAVLRNVRRDDVRRVWNRQKQGRSSLL